MLLVSAGADSALCVGEREETSGLLARLWCRADDDTTRALRSLLSLWSGAWSECAAAEHSTFLDSDAFGGRTVRCRVLASQSDGARVVLEAKHAGLRAVLHSVPHARLHAHSDEVRTVQLDRAMQHVVRIDATHVLHLPALPSQLHTTVPESNGSAEHTVISASSSLRLVRRSPTSSRVQALLAACVADDQQLVAQCMLSDGNVKRDSLHVGGVHQLLRVQMHDAVVDDSVDGTRKRQAPPTVSWAGNATSPAYVHNPRELSTCKRPADCRADSFGFRAPQSPRHRFERGVGTVNAFSVLRAVSDAKIPDAAAGGDIVVFAGAAVQVSTVDGCFFFCALTHDDCCCMQTSFFGVTHQIMEAYVRASIPRPAGGAALTTSFPPCAGIPVQVFVAYGSSDVAFITNKGEDTARWGCLDVTARLGSKSTCQPYSSSVFNETAYDFADYRVKLFDADGPVAVAGIPLLAKLSASGLVSFRYGVGWFVAGGGGGGNMFQVSVEPAVQLSFNVDVQFPVAYDDAVFSVAATANDQVLDASSRTTAASSSLVVIASINVDNELSCGSVQLSNTGATSRIDATLTALGKFRRSTPIYESYATPWQADVIQSDCCNLPPASCYRPSTADYRKGECKCASGWSGPGCDIVCPANCALPDDERMRKACSSGTCQCMPGFYGYECLLKCPGGGACSGHGTCVADGRCICAAGFFGRDCASTCDASCKGKCVWNGARAVCECPDGAAGDNCQSVCPTGGPQRQPCSGRGRCFNSGSATGACVCEVGYGGAACEFYAGPSGLALRFDGKPDSFAEFPLDKSISDNAAQEKRGITVAFWMRVDELPPAGAHATLVEFRYALVQLSSAGIVKMCDQTGGSDAADTCARAPRAVTARVWHHVAAGLRDELGNYQLAVHVFTLGAAVGSEASAINDPREFNRIRADTLRVGSGFKGSIDQLHVLALAPNFCPRASVTDAEVCRVMFSSRYSDELYQLLADVRSSLLHPSHPLVMFSTQLDTGAATTQYADAPLGAGAIKGGVSRVSADGIPMARASIASVVTAPFKLTLEPMAGAAASKPIPQTISYTLETLGRRYMPSDIRLVFVASTFSANGPYEECRISATLQPPPGAPASDRPIPVLSNFRVAGGRLQYEAKILSDYLGSGARNEIVWQLNGACDGGSRFVTIDSSLLLLQTAASDGVAVFGLHDRAPGSLTSGDVGGEPVRAPFEVSAWIWRDPAQQEARDGARGAIVQILPGGGGGGGGGAPDAAASLSLAEDWSATDADAGARVVFADGSAIGKDEAPFSTRVGVWEHVAMRVANSVAGQCRLTTLVNGRVASVSRDVACGGGGVVRSTDSGYRVRIGLRFRGRVNDVLLRGGQFAQGELSREIYSEYNGISSAHIAFWSFDGMGPDAATYAPEATRASGAFTLTPSGGGATVMERPAFRGTERCPGATTCALSPLGRGGECGEVDGSARCVCSKGYAGAECVECPGGARNPCSGHGVCIGLVDGAMCACRRGYLGAACEHTCPGMGAPENRNDFVCLNEGVCRMDGAQSLAPAVAGAGATKVPLARCFCGAARDRYGDFCQFQQGEKPVFALSCETCGDDGDRFKQCQDNICGCADGYYLAGAGGFQCTASRLREPPQTGASIGLLVGVLVVVAALMALVGWKAKRIYDDAPVKFEALVRKERSDASIRAEEMQRLQNIKTEAQW